MQNLLCTKVPSMLVAALTLHMVKMVNTGNVWAIAHREKCKGVISTEKTSATLCALSAIKCKSIHIFSTLINNLTLLITFSLLSQ